MNKQFYFILSFIFMISCSNPKVQRPIHHDKMQMNGSVAKKDYELDKEIIVEYTKRNDTLFFKNNPNGFWWSSLNKQVSNKKIDNSVQIEYTYSVCNFRDQEIYSKENIGMQYAVLNKTKQIRVLTEVFKDLSEGEKAILLVPSFLAYGFSGDGNKIGPAQPIIINLEILKLKQL